MADKLQISICISGHVSTDAPAIKISHNQTVVATAKISKPQQWIDFYVVPTEENQLTVDFYNKLPEHTICENNEIVSDMWLELHNIRVDDILLQSWFLNDGYYVPRYFEDFLKSFPDSPARLNSQRIWHFPGTYHACVFPEDIWAWYHFERTARTKLDNMDKDLHRWEKFVGSAERYPEIVAEIKELIRA
jgi:hypothetical protein